MSSLLRSPKNTVGIVNYAKCRIACFRIRPRHGLRAQIFCFQARRSLFCIRARHHVFRTDYRKFRLVVGVLLFGAEIINSLLKFFHLLGKTGTFRFFLHQDRFVTLERACVGIDLLAKLSGTFGNLIDRLALIGMAVGTGTPQGRDA